MLRETIAEAKKSARDANALSGVAEEALDSDTTITYHPLEGLTPKQDFEYVNKLGLKTPRDQLVL